MATLPSVIIRVKGVSRYVWRLRIAEFLVRLATWIVEDGVIVLEAE